MRNQAVRSRILFSPSNSTTPCATQPTLRYGNPAEFPFYATGISLLELARRLRRDERTVRDWLTGRARVPWWVPEILRLNRMEAELRHRHMLPPVPDQTPCANLPPIQSA